MAKKLFVRFGKEVYKEILNKNFKAIQNFKYYNKWKNSLEPGRNSISDEQPWITYPAIEFLKKHINSNTSIFEYGGGGSTLFFVNRAKEVITVEHDEGWFSKLEQKINVDKKTTNWEGNLILPEESTINLDLDPSDPHHYYTSDETYINSTFKAYASFIDRYPEGYFDIILVDGRSRPSCIWHSVSKIKKGGFLVVDNSNRKYYFSAVENILRSQFKLVFNEKAASPYAEFFTQTGVWRKE